MRVLCILLWSALSAGAAQASSFLVLAPMREQVGPSMVVLAEPAPVAAAAPFVPIPVAETPLSYPYPEDTPLVVLAPPAQEPVVISASIVAMGTPAVSLDKVAAIGAGAPSPTVRPPLSTPVVMRGGIIGDAFPSPTEPAPAEAEAPAARAAPGKGAGDAKGRRPAAPREPAPTAPPPAAAAPAPPTRMPE